MKANLMVSLRLQKKDTISSNISHLKFTAPRVAYQKIFLKIVHK